MIAMWTGAAYGVVWLIAFLVLFALIVIALVLREYARERQACRIPPDRAE